MRSKTSSQHHVSPHVSCNERKSLTSQTGSRQSGRSNHSLGSSDEDYNNNNNNNNNNNRASSMGVPAESPSVATGATDFSSSFFPDATFGEYGMGKPKRRSSMGTTSDQQEMLERIEKILRLAQKRLKKSRVEGFYERKKKKHGSASDGGILGVQHSDVRLDEVLGNGSYNVVYSVKRIRGGLLDRDEIVVKTLRSKLLSDLPMLAACAADLRKEGLILAALQQQALPGGAAHSSHKIRSGSRNIVHCLAWTPTGLSAFANGCHDSFFLILEKLDRTLTDTLKEWRALESASEDKPYRESLGKSTQPGLKVSSRSVLLRSVKNTFFSRSDSQRSCSETSVSQRSQRTGTISERDRSNGSSCSCVSAGCDPEEVRFWKLRLGLLMDLCGAVSFLHSQKVIHRDLKPDNVGFDKTGTLKVFDFDVSRILPHQPGGGDHGTGSETFKMTRKVGSPRYMSPEVARGEHYNEKADVYALGLLAYEVLTLKRPFETLSSREGCFQGGTSAGKDCVRVVVRGHDPNEEDERSGRKQKRRNSFGTFAFRRNSNSSATDHGACGGGGGSSGKLGSMFRKRSHSRGSSKKSSSKYLRAPKYANLRPLLPVATPHELAAMERQQWEWMAKDPQPPQGGHQHQHQHQHPGRRRPVRSGSLGSSSAKSTSSVRSHYHSVNDIDLATGSFFWTRSLRTTIDRSWSYDIPTRPCAGKLRELMGEELERIELHEDDPLY